MKELNVSLNPASWMTSRMMGVIAHDIRTPITVIRGYLKMMLSERTGPLNPAQKECLEAALNSMDQLTGLGGLISESAGKLDQIHAESLCLQEDLWKPSWRELQPHVAEKAILLKEQFPEHPLMVCGDRRLLREMLEKLISCSLSFAGEHTEMSVDVASRKTGEFVLKILVSGRSQGPKGQEVASELLPLVFLHGGKLTFSDRNENGSSFTLTLPGKDA